MKNLVFETNLKLQCTESQCHRLLTLINFFFKTYKTIIFQKKKSLFAYNFGVYSNGIIREENSKQSDSSVPTVMTIAYCIAPTDWNEVGMGLRLLIILTLYLWQCI